MDAELEFERCKKEVKAQCDNIRKLKLDEENEMYEKHWKTREMMQKEEAELRKLHARMAEDMKTEEKMLQEKYAHLEKSLKEAEAELRGMTSMFQANRLKALSDIDPNLETLNGPALQGPLEPASAMSATGGKPPRNVSSTYVAR